MIETKLIHSFPREIIAVDEVGRSPLSGPVVIGGVRVRVESSEFLLTLLRSLRRNGVKDSKVLSSEARQVVLQKFGIDNLPFREKGRFIWKGLEISFVTWEMDHDVIDSENIFQASMRGMREAALELASADKSQTTLLVDGHCKLRGEELEWEEHTIIKGDAKSPLIGLAAIIAKEKRDGFMKLMHELYPHYGFDTNVGYPTPSHRKAIEVHGPCLIHRKSFNKVKEFARS